MRRLAVTTDRESDRYRDGSGAVSPVVSVIGYAAGFEVTALYCTERDHVDRQSPVSEVDACAASRSAVTARRVRDDERLPRLRREIGYDDTRHEARRDRRGVGRFGVTVIVKVRSSTTGFEPDAPPPRSSIVFDVAPCRETHAYSVRYCRVVATRTVHDVAEVGRPEPPVGSVQPGDADRVPGRVQHVLVPCTLDSRPT